MWGATGPNSFDCSGLTQFVWGKAGVSIPRVAADQDAWTIPVPLSQLLPGDLVFFGKTDIHHVGIYIGDGLMINAPHTGDVVRVSSIWWSDLAGFGRVHAAGVPVPSHQVPTIGDPATAVVVAKAGPVPSQTKPPAGWKPKPGSSTPFKVYPGPKKAATTTSTTKAAPSTTSTTAPPGTTTSTASTSTTTTTRRAGRRRRAGDDHDDAALSRSTERRRRLAWRAMARPGSPNRRPDILGGRAPAGGGRTYLRNREAGRAQDLMTP